jgi:hypothetical protein
MTSKVMRSVVCLILLLGILSMTGLAANKSRIGTAGAQELLIPVGASGAALGSSAGIFMKGVDAIYWNPAGLSHIGSSVEAMFSSMSYIADVNVAYGVIGVQAGEIGTLGFSVKSISFGEIQRTTVEYPDGTGELYSPSYLTLGVTYSRLLTDRISIGLTGYVVSEKILNMSATGLVFDVGIQYHNLGIQGLMLGLAVKSIGPNMKFGGSNAYVQATAPGTDRGQQNYTVEMAGFEMPTMMEIGVGYTKKLDDKNGFALGAMFRNNNYQDDEYNVGTEYNFNDMVFIRGGYTFSPQVDKDPTGATGYIYDWTLGAGFKYDLGGIGLAVDYAYRNVKYFEGNNVFSIQLAF